MSIVLEFFNVWVFCPKKKKNSVGQKSIKYSLSITYWVLKQRMTNWLRGALKTKTTKKQKKKKQNEVQD